MANESMTALLTNLSIRSPMYVALFVAGVVLIAHLSSQPKPARLALSALGVLLFGSLVADLTSAFLPGLMENGWSVTSAGVLITLISFAVFCGDAVGIGLLVAAALTGREKCV